jgi:hypothetical protein
LFELYDKLTDGCLLLKKNGKEKNKKTGYLFVCWHCGIYILDGFQIRERVTGEAIASKRCSIPTAVKHESE